MSSADISIFYRKSATFVISYVWVYKGCFNKHAYNFGDVSKVGYSRPSLNKVTLK